jgi:YidC/Oxa1 family membrane protein insertase
MFEIPAAIMAFFYSLTSSYTLMIALMSVVVMAITTPLTLKSTKGMLEMQRLAPEMRKLQNEHRNDRQKLNEEMMKLYQDHKVNPMASCLPLLAQAPVFIIMFQIIQGLAYEPRGAALPVADRTAEALELPGLGFIPRYLSLDSDLYLSLFDKTSIPSLGLNLALTPIEALQDAFWPGIVYVLLVVALAGLYFAQQRMVAARASVSPTMSPAQQKVMQYLPVVFAVFQLFFLTGLVVYYIFQTLLRILQQAYITRKFYGHDESLGRQAQRAGVEAREVAKASDTAKQGDAKQGNAKQDAGKKASARNGHADPDQTTTVSKRVTPKKNASTNGTKGRPTPTRAQARNRPKSNGKRSR